MRATLIVLLIVVLLAVVAVALLSRDAAGIAIGLAMGMLCTLPGLWVILAQRAGGEQPQAQRPAPPAVTVLPAPRGLLVDVDGEWRRIE